MLDRSSPLPLYYQLRTALLQQIEDGTFQPGDLFPAEQELIERYRVSRITIRQALNSLMADGLLYRQRGLGTFVRRNRIEQDLSTLTGFSEEMAARGLSPSTRLIKAEMVEPDSALVARLQLGEGQRVLRLERLRLANGEPMAMDVTHVPSELGERLLRENMEEALYTLLARLGVELDWADQAIQSAPADEFTAHHLGIKKGTPVLLMKRVVYATDGRAVEFSSTSYRADRYTYRVRLKRGRGASPSGSSL